MARRPCILLAAASTLVLSTAALAQPTGVDHLLKQGEFWRAKGRADLALEAFRRVLSLDPANAEAKKAVEALQNAGAQAPPAPVAASASRPLASKTPATAKAAEGAKHALKASRVDAGGPERVEGFAALNRNEFDAAVRHFRAALAVRAADGDSLGGLGVAYLRQGDFTQAREFLTKARKLSGAKWADALHTASFYADLAAAVAARDAGDLDKAEAAARGLIAEGDDQTASATRLLADILVSRGNPGAAQSLYATALEKAKPSDKPAIATALVRAKASALAAAGDTKGAMAVLQTAIAGNPASPWLLHDYADLLLQQQKTSEALETIDPLLNKMDVESLYAGALILVEAGQDAEAEDLIAKISPEQMSPALRQFAVELKMTKAIERARTLYKSGRIDEAASEVAELEKRGVSSASVEGKLAEAYLDFGRPDAAGQAATRATALPASDPLSYSSAVIVLVKVGKEGEASSVLDTLSRRFGESPALRHLRGEAAAAAADRLRGEGELARAFDLLQSAWSADPGDLDLLGATARLYETGAMPLQAGQVYEQILKQKPMDVDGWLGLARTAAAARQPDLARKALAHAVRLDAKNVQTFTKAADVARGMGDRRLAKLYLDQARTLVVQEDSLAAGQLFPTSNPFVRQRPQLSGGSGAMGGDINPFALAKSAPKRLDDPLLASTAPTDPFLPAAAQKPTLKRDAELSQLDTEIDSLSTQSAPSVSAEVDARNRQGEQGLSALSEIQAKIRAEALIGDVKIAVTATPTVLSPGSISQSGLARFGQNATPEAEGIVALQPAQLAGVGTQHNSGVGFGAEMSVAGFTADAGVTPLGFERVTPIGKLDYQTNITPQTVIDLSAERAGVDDSATSYSGSKDPVSGKVWGAVAKNVVSASVAFDNHNAGVYFQADARSYDGVNVKSNTAGEVNAGVYISPYQSDVTRLTIGANVNFQAFANNQDYFTFGNGGYFSPQDFAAISFPITLKTTISRWQLSLSAAPGYQNFDEAQTPIYPTLPQAQDALNTLKIENVDVRSYYDSLGKSGFAINSGIKALYPISSSTSLNLGLNYNSFGAFNETTASVQLTQLLGGH